MEQGQLRLDLAKIEVVVNWPQPTSRKKLQRFLRFSHFYQHFIQNYSKVAALLTHLTSTSVPFCWSAEAEAAFTFLQTLFPTAPVLCHPDVTRQFAVEVGGGLLPWAFFSCWLIPTEWNYDVENCELLAMKLTLEEWRLEGVEQLFLVWTHHRNLEYLWTVKGLNTHQARWTLFFGQFRFTLSYRPGSSNGKSDSLSRVFAPEATLSDPDTILPPSHQVAEVAWKLEGLIWAALATQPDHRPNPVSTLFVPRNVRTQTLQWAHASHLSYHPGVERTLAFLRQHLWWPTIAEDTRAFVRACTTCTRSKAPSKPASGLHPLPVPGWPWSHIEVLKGC